MKNVLCIRLDNMGDVIMSSPAIRAIKETFQARITLLTSQMGSLIAPHLEEVDEVMVYNVPWVKLGAMAEERDFFTLVQSIKERRFDAAVIFTVFSQNPLPAAMLAFFAEIPVRVAYCRENPYALLTHWVPDPEPYTTIRHQVRRDLDLVKALGAIVVDDALRLSRVKESRSFEEELEGDRKIDWSAPFVILHPGVSEKKRRFSEEKWTRIGKALQNRGMQTLVTGSASERDLAARITSGVGAGCHNLAGGVSISNFVELIRRAVLVVSVNTSTVHIAAAVATPVIVLYALTNPQHPPWRAKGRILPFDVDEEDRSKNEVLRFVRRVCYPDGAPPLSAGVVIQSIQEILDGKVTDIPELVDVSSFVEASLRDPVFDRR